jgi:hypothetical protein
VSRFLTPLKVEKIGYDQDGRALYRLLARLVYLSDRFGRRVVPAGFVTNFASVPRLPVVFLVAGGRAEEEATVHDYEYTVREKSRDDCDAQFLESLQADKPYATELKKPTPKWLAYVMYEGVHLGGRSAYAAETTVAQPTHVSGKIVSAQQLEAA